MFHPTGEPGPYPEEPATPTLEDEYRALQAERQSIKQEIAQLVAKYNSLDLPRESASNLDAIGYKITELQNHIEQLDRQINDISRRAILDGNDPTEWHAIETEDSMAE